MRTTILRLVTKIGINVSFFWYDRFSRFLGLILTMGLKIIESFDSSFILDLQAKETLFNLLKSEGFIEQVSEQIQGVKVEFTELIFQPTPYSAETPKGMPAEFEPYHHSEDHVIINVPPNFMFKAKIFQPSRLCAIYRKLK